LTHILAEWDNFITTYHGHLLQSWAWGELKSRFGWTAHRIQVDDAAAQILFRRLPLGLTIAYIPKGPVVDWTNRQQCQALFSTIHTEAKNHRAIFLKVEPHLWCRFADCSQSVPALQAAAEFLVGSGFILADTVQPRTSLVVDISGDEDAVLAAMKQKTRYNIRLATKKGVTVRMGSAADVNTFYDLSVTTSTRDGFGIHSLDYYQAAYDLFAPDRGALLLSEFEGEPLAALMAFCHGLDAFYFFGASSNRRRKLMPNYLVQWAAIQWARNQGCIRYDLWGIPDADPTTLEAEFQKRRDGLWGVYRFKRGFGGQVVQSIGAYDYVYNPVFYQLYKLRRGL
jgi:lipid II:glycine glycyltransferase (peptidoglycan interpeptide bridge formation enzyme)